MLGDETTLPFEPLVASPADILADAFIMMDLEGRVADWSEKAEHLFGWTREEARGQLLGSLIVPQQHRDAHWAGLERYRKTGQGPILNQRLKLTALNRAGDEFPVEFSVTPTRIDGQVLFCGVIRSLSRQSLRRDPSRQRAIDSRLFQQAASRWWTADSFEAALQDCVDTLCDLTGWPIGHALVLDSQTETLKSADVWHLDDEQRFAPIVDASQHQRFSRSEGLPGRIWTAGETVWNSDIGESPRFTRDQFSKLGLQGVFGFPIIVDGETVAVLEFFTAEALAPDPQLLMQVSSLSTQLARTLEKRRWEAERLRLAAIVDSSYDAIISKDAEGNIVSWNSGAEQVYGFTADEAIGQSMAIILPQKLAAASLEEPELEDALRAGRSLVQFETTRKHKSGRLIPVAITMAPLRDSKGRIVGSSMIERDMSGRQEREQELEAAKEQAEQANRMKSEFLANISHELRTPMSAIIGMLELSLAEDINPLLEDYLSTARDSAETLLHLLNDLLDFSRMEAGRFELEEEPFSLHDVVDVALKTLSLRAHEKGLELAARINPQAPDHLLGDGHRLRQVLINLVSNAIKFTEQGEVTVTVSVGERQPDRIELTFSVKDTGVGISRRDQEKVFRPFTQLDASTTRRETGTGLGLAICQELIHKMGGKLSLHSQSGRGSTFSFTLRFPVVIGNAESHATFIPDLSDISVLVVDDNETNRTILEETLAGWNMRPTVLSDGTQVLKEVRRAQKADEAYELIIVDALMPGMDGFSLIESLNDDEIDLATVLMVSSADRQTFKDRCDHLEIAAYLEKPISQSDMLDAVVTALKGVHVDNDVVDQIQESKRALNILLAEDTPANQKVIKAILSKRGHEVDIAHNGREAIDRHKQNEYDLILMDVQMPTMDGLQATEAIRKLDDPLKASIPIVAMTAHAQREDRLRCRRAGMTGYLSKPINTRRLLELVEYSRHRGTSLRRSSTEHSIPKELTQPTESRPSVMNRDAALARLGDKEDLLKDLMQYFLGDAPELMDAARVGINSNNAEEVHRAAHSLRGLAANFDAKQLMSTAGRLEQIGQSGDLTAAPDALAELRVAVDELTTELREEL